MTSGTVAQMGMSGVNTASLGSQLGRILRNLQPSSGGNWAEMLMFKDSSRGHCLTHLILERPELEFSGRNLFPLRSRAGPTIQH